MSQQERLKQLAESLASAKETKIKAEARMAELNRRENEIIAKVKAKGFDPDSLEEERVRREARLSELLAEIEQTLNGGTRVAVAANKPSEQVAASVKPQPAAPAAEDDIPW